MLYPMERVMCVGMLAGWEKYLLLIDPKSLYYL